MKAKITCSVINDMLPLYIDKVLSRDSTALVEEHLEECKFCRASLDQMESTLVIEKDNDNSRIKKLKKRVGIRNFVAVSCLCLFAIVVLLASGFFIASLIGDRSADNLSEIYEFNCIVTAAFLSISVLIGWGLYIIYFMGRTKENISAVVKKKAIFSYSLLLIVCVMFLLGYKLAFLGTPACSDDVRVRTEFQYSEDSYLEQEWVIHFMLTENNKALNVISEAVYEENERGERQNTGVILHINEVPIKALLETNTYTCGYSCGESYTNAAVPTSANYTFTLVYKDKTVIYDMRKEGLYEKQENVKHFPLCSDINAR